MERPALTALGEGDVTVQAIILLDVITGLARQDRTMIVVTHEMGFARAAADRVIFMDQGRIVEEGAPATFFDAPRHPRTRQFLSQILH